VGDVVVDQRGSTAEGKVEWALESAMWCTEVALDECGVVGSDVCSLVRVGVSYVVDGAVFVGAEVDDE
jgi:hypothetical protein